MIRENRVINTTTDKVVEAIRVGRQPIAAAFDSHNDEIYVANYCSECVQASTVSVINTTKNKVVATIHVGVEPIAVIFNPANSYTRLYAQGTYDVLKDAYSFTYTP